MSELQTEIDTFERLLPKLLVEHDGKFAVIKGEELIETFDSYEDALKCGYAKFGLETFFVKKIAPADQVAFFTRMLSPCPA